MNHQQAWDVHQQHLPSSHHQGPPPVSSGGMPQYPYQQPLPMPSQPNYSTQTPYPPYGYSNALTSPQSTGHQVAGPMGGSQMTQHMLPQLPAMATSQPPQSSGMVPNSQYPQQQQPPATMDTTGQVAPAGMKPRVTATLWEDEGSLCFQVEAKGVCVARREDNHMINGTKLLNVAGMTRGRRDGILKSEKMRHVVKIGPMHLKGVWIPFERALDFANKEKITEMLYPLFVHNIGALLYNPINQTHRAGLPQGADRRPRDSQPPNGALPTPSSRVSAPPPLHHHHSMQNGVAPHLPGPALSSQNGGRPSLDRAHTFPTPPTSASSGLGMSGHDGSFQWNGPSMSSVQGNSTLSIDTGLSNTRSMPSTPATTPPGTSIQNMQQYSGGQTYDTSRSMYSVAPQQHGQYAPHQPSVTQQNMARFGQPGQYVKNEMGPPSSRASEEHKVGDGLITPNQPNGSVGHGEEEAEHEHDAEYTHDNNSAYNANRGTYYSTAPPVGPLPGEHPHLSPEMTGSPHHSASGRATPRAGPPAAQSWGAVQQPGGYHTPPRNQPPANNLYSINSDQRGPATNGVGSADPYAPYAPSAPTMNGTKRMREIDDDGDRGSRPGSRGPGDIMDPLKRRKTFQEGQTV